MVGHKSVAMQPGIMGEFMPKILQATQRMQPELVLRMRERMKAKGVKL